MLEFQDYFTVFVRYLMKESLLCIYVHFMKLIGQKTCDSTSYCQFLDLFFFCEIYYVDFVTFFFFLYVCMYYWPFLTHMSEIWAWTKRDVSILQSVEREY